MNPYTKQANTTIYHMLNEELKNKATVLKPSEYENSDKIDKIEEFLKNKRKDIYSSNLRSETRYETIMLIQEILSIIDKEDKL